VPGLKIKKGDLVEVRAGKDRGKQGRVLEAHPADNKVVVENLNLAKRHQRPRPIRNANRMGGQSIIPGGIVERPAPLQVSNVMLVCPTCKQPTKVGYKFSEYKGQMKKVRICRNDGCGQEIDR
jgi:large subunit ribosomal protein L24